MRLYRSSLMLAALLAITAISPTLWAARLPDAQREAEISQLRTFDLTDRFVDKFLAAKSDPDYPAATLDLISMAAEKKGESLKSLSQQIDMAVNAPGVVDFLARHDLSAREFVLGRDMLFYAAMMHLEQQHPDWVGNDEDDDEDQDEDSYEDDDADENDDTDLSRIVSPANLAIYLRNMEKINRTMMEVGRRRMQNYKTTSGK